MTFGGGDDVFLALVQDLHRLAAGAGQERRVRRDHVRIVFLAPEAASGHRLSNPNGVIPKLEEMGERLVDVVGTLQRAHDVDALEGGSRVQGWRGDDPVGFDVGVLLMAGRVLAFDDHVRLGEPLVDVPVGDLALGKDVQAAVRPRVARERFIQVQNRFQDIVRDLDQAGRGPGAGEGGGDHQGHRLANVVDATVGQNRPVVLNQVHGVPRSDIPGGEDFHLRVGHGGRIDRCDQGRWVRRANRDPMEAEALGEIVEVEALPVTLARPSGRKTLRPTVGW